MHGGATSGGQNGWPEALSVLQLTHMCEGLARDRSVLGLALLQEWSKMYKSFTSLCYTLIVHIICKYFLQFDRVSFHFVCGFLRCAKSLKFA